MAEKVLNLRIFENEEGKLNYSVKDRGYQILCISNFTLCANTEKGRRPSFENSMSRQEANKYYQDFVCVLKSQGVGVEAGVFGEHMDISLDLDGPVNIMLEI
jgi:D-tyrosyl-tRNA(Tyr) deacylase